MSQPTRPVTPAGAEVTAPSAGDYLRLSAARFPGRACFVDGSGREQSFAETNSRVNRLASALLGRGIGKGDRIAIFANNSVVYAEILFAALKLGATYVPLNSRLGQAETHALLAAARPRAIFADARYAPMLGPLLPERSRPRVVIDEPAAGFEQYEAFIGEGGDAEPGSTVRGEDIVGLAFTSGTTGRPKGVLQSDRMIRNLTTSIALDYEIMPDEFRYSSSPMFHIGGQSPVFLHAWRGFPTLILPRFDVETVLTWLQTGGLTGCFLVPTMISSLLAHPKAGDSDYRHLRSIIYGAAPMPPDLLRRALKVFRCEFVNAFGAGTEAGLQTVLSSADHRRAVADEEHLLGSIGKPAYGVDLRLVDGEDCDVPRGAVGEIITRNDRTMSGYAGMPEETEKALRGGWFHAGDLAYMDEQGYLYLAGRRDDMIICGGENIYPVEVEDAITSFDQVEMAAVIGARDEHWGEAVVAFVTPAADSEVNVAELREHCRAALASYKVPSRFIVRAELPMNASGKILRRELREWLAGEEPAN
jgi:acyl-CoA synthetase (AMP-forming)/AMP-acid ligase II